MQVGSIVLPDSATEKIHQGVVIEVGPGARNPFVSIWHCLRHAPSLCVHPFLCCFCFAPLRSHSHRTTGVKFPMTVKKGDRVLLPDFTPTMFKVGNDKYGLYSEQDILCTLHDE